MYEACGSMCRLAECVCWKSYGCVHYSLWSYYCCDIVGVYPVGVYFLLVFFFFAMLTCTVYVGQEVCPCRIVINI